MMFLNFVAPHWIEKAFNKITDVNLDPKMFVNKRFLASVKNNTLELPASNNAKDMLDFIDNNPKALFTKLAGQNGKVKLLENGVRDPRAYVDIDELVKFKDNIEKFAKNAKESGVTQLFNNPRKYRPEQFLTGILSAESAVYIQRMVYGIKVGTGACGFSAKN